MNILQIVPELKVGGVETGTVDLARGLIQRGHRCVVISAGGSLVKKLLESGCRHYLLPVHKKSPLTMLRMINQVREIIEKENIDIVHARSRVPAIIAFFAYRYTRPLKSSFITTCHGYYGTHILSRVMGWGEFVIVASQIIGRHMIDDFGVPYQRIRLIPRGVDTEKFKFHDLLEKKSKSFTPLEKKSLTGFTIGIIGRITPLKGHTYFIKAVAKVSRVIPKLRILIIGDVPPEKEGYKQQLKLLIMRLGLERFVEFLGYRDDIPEILSNLDLLVLATTTPEAFGRVIIEAGANGVPVVATKVGGVVDIIEDGLTGILVPPEDIAAMAEAIIKLLKDRKYASQIARQARRKIEKNFRLEQMVERNIHVYEEALNSKRILVIKMTALGDVVLSVPALRALREKFPRAYISVLVSLQSRPILQRCPYINEVITYDNRDRRSMNEMIRLARRLQRGNFDIVVDLQNNRRSHILNALSFAPQRYGYDNKKFSFLLNYRVKEKKIPLSPVEHQFGSLSMLGIKSSIHQLELWPSSFDFDWAESFLQNQWLAGGQRLVGINISAGARWLTKRWSLEKFAQLADLLAREHIRVVITGTKLDRKMALRFRQLSKAKPIDACGKTSIMQFACLLKHCRVFITPDSAPMHIAAAMKVPFVALFGPTDPQRHLPPTRDFIVIKKSLKCSPCYRRKCRNVICMKRITVEEVYQAIKQLL